MSDQQDIVVGEITGVFGVKGWVKVYSHTEPRENILKYSPWNLKKGDEVRQVELVNGKRQGKAIVAQIQGIDDRDQAASLNGWMITVKGDQLPKAEQGEYYWKDLIGLTVVTERGVQLGKVDYLLETGANDVLVVAGDRERLIPFLQGHTVLKIDLDVGEILVDWDPEF